MSIRQAARRFCPTLAPIVGVFFACLLIAAAFSEMAQIRTTADTGVPVAMTATTTAWMASIDGYSALGGELTAEDGMADRDKPRRIAVGWQSERSTSAPDLPLERFRSNSRTEKELEPIAARVAENAALMQRFRASLGSENRDLVREVNGEVTRYAQELDPTITFDEGTTIVVALLKMVGHFRESRTEQELEPLATRIAENAALMQRFRAAARSENKRLVWEVMAEVRSYAQELDPRILYEEQTTVIALLTKMVGHSKDAIGGSND
jgi:hypothetical protein